MARRAAVLMNLGGPDSPKAVRPFLYNLFSDPAIIGLPTVLRRPLAWLIAAQRHRIAAEIYAHLGGASPLLVNTEAQARALEAELSPGYRCFVAMRYWHPLTEAAVVERIKTLAATNPHPLVERFAESVAQLVLTEFGAPSVKVRIAKLAPLPGVRELGVMIERDQAASA